MWTPKYENGCLIMLKYALEPLYAPEPLCDCLHQVVTVETVFAKENTNNLALIPRSLTSVR